MTRMAARKRIALVAHDAMKPALVAWAARNRDVLARHDLWGTGTTGGKVAEGTGLEVTRLKSGPLGGDQQIGAMIAEGELDILVFFSDPLTAMPHDVDVKALLRISTLEQVVVACNAATADFVVASGLLEAAYSPVESEAAHAG
ncbi:methylglyoxal synthase [Tropicimonas marinistellae]|uniref:methylglyoxal synthase n=1 Tax=Tropicimonas marinistellae TaxID=1739787 RepID=UPI0008300573|nr:methylglyoxal synthase [Tropicimonas marinistellae]